MRALLISEGDSVATALDDIKSGDPVELILSGTKVKDITACDAIPFGFKISTQDIPAGTPVIKYSHAIGKASKDIKQGELVHIHNIEGNRGRGDLDH